MVINVDVSELKDKLKKEQRARIILIIICILLAIAAIVLISSYVLIKKKSTPALNLCESDLCMRSAATLRLAMNTSVDPCDDFYKFACGHWTAEHPDHGWFSPVSAFTMVEEAVTAATLKFLQSNGSKTEPQPVKQSRDLYASCMNQVATDKLGYRPIFKYLSLLGLPAIPKITNLSDNANIKDRKLDWIRIEALSNRLLGDQSFIGFSVEYNVTNTSQHFIQMGVPPLMNYPLPRFLKPVKHRYYRSLRHSKEEIKDETNLTDYRIQRTKKMIYFFIYTVVAANYSEYSELPDDFSEVINKTSDIIMKMTEEIAELHSLANPPENCTNSTDCEAHIGISVNELQDKTNEVLLSFNLTPKEIWKPYLQQIFDGINVTLDFNKNVSLLADQYDVLYLVTIVRYLSELPDELMELWYWWRTLYRLITTTTTDINKYFEDLSETSFDEPKILRCIAITKEYMGMAVSYAIADKIILNNTRQKVEDMIIDIKTAFAERIEQIEWMDKETKILTLEKCNEMMSLVGYPDWLTEEGALTRYYANVIIHPDTFLDNLLSIVQRNVNNTLQKLYAAHDRDWPENTFPVTANAFHVPWDNTMNVIKILMEESDRPYRSPTLYPPIPLYLPEKLIQVIVSYNNFKLLQQGLRISRLTSNRYLANDKRIRDAEINLADGVYNAFHFLEVVAHAVENVELNLYERLQSSYEENCVSYRHFYRPRKSSENNIVKCQCEYGVSLWTPYASVVPMAFLFYPLYNLGLEVLNYAATGCTLGHELIHGFDNTGRQFDKHGNNIQWWDEEIIDKFEELAECFVEQYNKFYVPEVDIYVNGEISLGENIADNDGLRLAYMAYKNYRKRNKKEPNLPALGQYTEDQMFFIAYASTWCDEIHLDNMAYYEEEPHCPKVYRLIGSIQNSHEFAKAFKCPKGSKMNPDEPKCNIW